MADVVVVRRWMERLGRLTVASMQREDAEAWMNDVAPFLAEQFPDWVFCQRSLGAVAAECRHLPMFGEIVDELRKWRKAVPDDTGAQQRIEARSQQEREAAQGEALAAERRESWRDPQAVRDRVRWIEGQPDATRIDGVIRASFRRTLVRALQANAPQHLGLLPPGWLEEEGAVVPMRRAAAAAIRPEVRRGDA